MGEAVVHINPNKRIMKNSLFLYFRMLLVMLVTLYTSRMILKILGEEDFGIYNIVGGIAGMFAFFTSSLSNSTQRYLTFYLGKNDHSTLQKIFSLSLTIYLIISLTVIVLGELIGLWFLNEKLNIPQDRMGAAFWVFHSTIISLFFTLNGIVFNSVLMARENMKIYAYFSIVESLLKLSVVFILFLDYAYDKLKVYSVLFLLVTILIQSFYAIYCYKKYPECRLKFFWDSKLFLEMFKMIGWNGFSTAVWAINGNGISIILNIYFGPIANAARGLASQVEAAINSFSNNFFSAVRPQIVKSYASENYHYFSNLLFYSSKYSFYLLFALCIPLFTKCEYILELWLGSVPFYTVEFVHWSLLFALVNILINPFWYGILAIGKLKKYCLIGSLVYLLVFPLSLILVHVYNDATIVYKVLVSVRCVYHFVTLYIFKSIFEISISKYITKVLTPIVLVSLLSYVICDYIERYFSDNLFYLFLYCVVSVVIILLITYVFGISSEERKILVSKLKV